MAASEVAVPATAIACCTSERWCSGTAAASVARTSPRTASSSASDGGSESMWRSDWRTTPAWVETWKRISWPVPMTSSVEPPPMSTTSVGAESASRSLVAPRNVRRASSSPLSTWGSKPKRSRTTEANSSPLAASRTALVSTATRERAPWWSIASA